MNRQDALVLAAKRGAFWSNIQVETMASTDPPAILKPTHTFERAAQRVGELGFTLFAEGDWSLVYRYPGDDMVLRITPYDAAYRHFCGVCRADPHPNLPNVIQIHELARNAYAVTMPLYQSGLAERCAQFLDTVKSAMTGDGVADARIDRLALILRRGCEAGEAGIPYFAGMDWNPENVLFDGTAPIFIDAFYQRGAEILKAIYSGAPLEISDVERDDFLRIPYFSR